MQMSKSYFEKLKDPRWQKKRLEVLDYYCWACESCGDSENTLHVHHKQYFKGREPWEYEVKQLAVLCESCHKSKHDDDDEDSLLVAISFLPVDGPTGRDAIASLVAGFTNQGMCEKHVSDPESYLLGALAYLIAGSTGKPSLLVQELDDIVSQAMIDKSGLIDVLRQFLNSHKAISTRT